MNQLAPMLPGDRPRPTPRLVQVIRVEQVSPRVRRIVLGGEALDSFVTAAPDDHVKLFVPTPNQDRSCLPVLETDRFIGAEDTARWAMRDYTPRRFDPRTRELTVEFVLHGTGPASEWAAQATPGQWIGVAGPKRSRPPQDDRDGLLLVGDETALPAIGRQLEELTPGISAFVLVEVADAREERYLPTAANARVTWLHRDGVPAGASSLLERALSALDPPSWDIHAWLAGEIETVRRLRRLLMERGLPRERIRAGGYWRVGEPDAHARVEDDAPSIPSSLNGCRDDAAT